MIDLSLWWPFLLVFVRITSFFATAPVFSGRQIPARQKVAFSIVLSALCAGTINTHLDSVAMDMLFLLILKEAFAGAALGLAAAIFFYAVQVAGTLIDFQIGFLMANFFDPTFQTNTQLTGRLKNVLAVLILLATNGHHLLIQGLLASFDWIPLDSYIPAWSDGRLASFLLDCTAKMFQAGFMMAAPIMGTLFIVDIALGIISKTVPQMNLIAIFPPIKILLHFAVYLLVLPGLFYLMVKLFETMFTSMSSMMKIMGA